MRQTTEEILEKLMFFDPDTCLNCGDEVEDGNLCGGCRLAANTGEITIRNLFTASGMVDYLAEDLRRGNRLLVRIGGEWVTDIDAELPARFSYIVDTCSPTLDQVLHGCSFTRQYPKAGPIWCGNTHNG